MTNLKIQIVPNYTKLFQIKSKAQMSNDFVLDFGFWA